MRCLALGAKTANFVYPFGGRTVDFVNGLGWE